MLKSIAVQFGKSLDEDDFETTKGLLSKDCMYEIGDQKLIGPDEICNSYEQNMIEGRKKLDELIWGKSQIELISELEYYVYFTDYLTHKGESHVHRCKQRLSLNREGMIIRIQHISDRLEEDRLAEYYERVGVK